MNTRTPHFVGSRLLEAREVRGLTQLALGELLGVSAQAISQYEKGQASPQPQVMEKLPTVLGVPPAFFVTPRPEPGETPLFFRSMARSTATMRTRARHKYHWLTDLVDYLGTYVELPAVQLPEYHFPGDPLAIEDEAVE
ncbi:helix-turn-helix domain-containing protein [Candidatus Entotheonella palauensis]|uniref:helix-turn-helix domain-containing protein n=1 Tax=Candidatus Entotheonella palauensis TaxID=93172 RepID=UPI000B80038C|nr:helix-turn-helix transcriptional regulator [Candidatus Entotheonella palauensis]